MVHQFQLYGEQSLVDLLAQLVPFEHQGPLRPDGAGINRILCLDQGHDDAIFSLEYLPYMRGPATPFRKIARVNDKGRSVLLPILGRDDLMARDQEEDVPAGQLALFAGPVRPCDWPRATLPTAPDADRRGASCSSRELKPSLSTITGDSAELWNPAGAQLA